MISVAAVPFMFIIRRKPENPPSITAETQEEERKDRKLSKEIKQLLENKNYRLLIIMFTGMYSIWGTIGKLVGIIFATYGFSVTQISTFACFFIISGVTYGKILTWFNARNRYYVTSLRAICISSTVMCVLFCFMVPTGNFVLAVIWVTLFGMSIVPAIPTAFAFSTELTQPA